MDTAIPRVSILRRMPSWLSAVSRPAAPRTRRPSPDPLPDTPSVHNTLMHYTLGRRESRAESRACGDREGSTFRFRLVNRAETIRAGYTRASISRSR